MCVPYATKKNIAPKEALTLEVVGGNPEADFEGVIKKMANLTAINTVTQKGEGTASFMVGTTEYAVPLGNLIDVEAEIAKQEAELKHLEGFLTGVLKKLSNERFVANAPLPWWIWNARNRPMPKAKSQP